MKSPTAAQMKVLEAMRDGATLYFCQPANNQHWAMFGVPPINATIRVHSGTGDAMRFMGYIEPGGAQDGRCRTPYTLTALGRQALEKDAER